MPSYLDVIEANKFQTAPESDIFPLPIVAIALGIGRNKMCQIPVIPIMIDKRKCYRKSDILNWAIAEQVKGKDNLLLKLIDENSSIGRAERNRSKFWDYYLSNSNDSHYRPSSVKGETKEDKFYRLRKEWCGNRSSVLSELLNCSDNEKLKELMILAWNYREQFIKFRMGLPYGIKLGCWWFEKDFENALEARKSENRKLLQTDIDYHQEKLDTNDFSDYATFGDINFDVSQHKLELKQLIEELRAELKELG